MRHRNNYKSVCTFRYDRTMYEFSSVKGLERKHENVQRKQKKNIASRYGESFAIINFSYLHELLISRKESHQCDLFTFHIRYVFITPAEQDGLESRYILTTSISMTSHFRHALVSP